MRHIGGYFLIGLSNHESDNRQNYCAHYETEIHRPTAKSKARFERSIQDLTTKFLELEGKVHLHN